MSGRPVTVRANRRDILALPILGERYDVRVDGCPGLEVRVTPAGARTYAVRYWVRDVRALRRTTIGPVDTVSLPEARSRAEAIRGDAVRGEDHTASVRARREALTVRELGERFLTEAAAKCKPTTVREYRREWTRYILPAIGDERVRDVTHEQAEALHRSLAATPIIANRTLALLSSFFTYAERHRQRDRNTSPTTDVQRFKENRRERFLQPDELTRLLEALDTAERVGLPCATRHQKDPETGKTRRLKIAGDITPPDRRRVTPANPHVVAAIRLLLLTGWREREVVTLRWSDIDFSRGLVTLHDTKTGDTNVPLSKAAAELLGGLPRVNGSPYVFPSPNLRKGVVRPLSTLDHVWNPVRRAAGLEDFRLHDLRHSAASFALAAGTPLAVVGKLLGHRHPTTTARYAHLADDPVRKAADAVAAAVAGGTAVGKRRARLAVVPKGRSAG